MGVKARYPEPEEETIELFTQTFGIDNATKFGKFVLNRDHTVAMNDEWIDVSEDGGLHTSGVCLSRGEFLLSGKVHLGRTSKYGYYKIGKGVYSAEKVKKAIEILCHEYQRWVDFWNFYEPGDDAYVLGLGNDKALILIAPVIGDLYGGKSFERFIIHYAYTPLMIMEETEEDTSIRAETNIEVDIKLVEKWIRELGLSI
ncbi:MAG: hypothetical protein ACXQTI_01300 [Candidatus Nezhaarchaeales archaeon]